MRMYSDRAARLRDRLVRAVNAFHLKGVNAELVVDEAIEKGLKTIHHQLCGSIPPDIGGPLASTDFRFGRSHGLGLEKWLLRLIGRTFAREKRGIVGGHARRANKQIAYEVPFVDALDCEEAGFLRVPTWTDDARPDDETLTLVLEQLKPRQRFIVEVRFGIPTELGFDVQGLPSRAVRAGLPRSGDAKIASRAKWAGIAAEAMRLQIQQIAGLLNLSSKQVGRDLLSTLKEIKRALMSSMGQGAA